MARFLTGIGYSTLLLLTACEREILPIDDLDDGDASAPDAMVEMPGASTPDATTSEPAPGCTDGDTDGDGVCNGVDNCPEDKNPNQNASACITPTPPKPGGNCGNVTVPNSSQLAGVTTLSKVRVANQPASAVVTVKKSETFTVELTSTCLTGSLPVVGGIIPPTVVVGFEGAGVGECKKVEGCGSEGSVSVRLTAPSTPGGFYIVAEGHTEFGGVLNACNDSIAGPLVEQIAAICVE